MTAATKIDPADVVKTIQRVLVTHLAVGMIAKEIFIHLEELRKECGKDEDQPVSKAETRLLLNLAAIPRVLQPSDELITELREKVLEVDPNCVSHEDMDTKTIFNKVIDPISTLMYDAEKLTKEQENKNA